MSIFAYFRVSTDKQTIENQRFRINYYCDRNNIKIDKWSAETISGKAKLEKRNLCKLLKKMKKNDTLICAELSRISRNMFDMMAILGECEKRGINVITVRESFSLLGDRMNRYIAPVVAAMSDMERDLISVRTREALQRLREQGIKLGRPVGSKSKVTKLMGKEEIILKMRAEKVSMRKIALKLKVDEKTIRNFIKENA